jgi:transcriptional regulator with XRE-family HTH domain
MLIHGTRLRGSAHGGSKITEKIALEIRSLRGKVPQANLVARFGISQTTISRIQNGERWAWLE